MRIFYVTILSGLFLLKVVPINAQNPTFRFGVNSDWFKNELGAEDVNHPLLDLFLPANNTAVFAPDINYGIEGEVLFPVSVKSFIGVEFESNTLSGSNVDSTLFNFLLTPYNAIDTFILAPYAYKTSLLNILANYKYRFNSGETLTPFLKLTCGVSFVATDFTFKNDETALGLDTNILYSRGTSNSSNSKKPALKIGAGLGLDYKISDNVFLQIEGAANIINSDIVDGVPNFTYENNDGKEILKNRQRQALAFQVSASLCYSMDQDMKMGTKSGRAGRKSRGKSGKADSHLPFYRKK